MKLAPIVATFHSAGESAAYRVFNRQLTRIASRIDIRVAVSKDAVELAQRYISGEYEVLFNGIELGAYSGAELPRENAVFFIGRHEPRKGLGVLLGALEHLPADVALWVASDGPETAELRRRFGSDTRVEWLGRISDAEKVERLKRARVFCAPSLRGESFGVVLLEAMAAGTPVVASNIDGYTNVATHDADALLVEPGDERALAAAIARVMVDPRLAARLVAAGTERSAGYSMDALAAHYVGLYERALRMEEADPTVVEVPRMLRRFEHRLVRRPRIRRD
jgi:phosphatidylinositol alpha-mannosyltransferase